MENTGQDMGRQQRRVFQHESHADHDSAGLSRDGYVARQVCHGYCGCTRCMDDTTSQQLTSRKDGGSGKIVYMGHRRWLE